MFTSADSLLIEVAGVFVPALIITVFSILYSYQITARYKRAIKRLYKMSFKGVDTERKRIAAEMHDHLALHSITLSQEIASLKKKLNDDQLKELIRIESYFDLFQHRTHQIIEYMYPKVLIESDWEASLEQLAQQLSIGKIRVSFESFVTSYPKKEWLYHTYWAIQEIVTNAVRHSKVNRIQISAVNENGFACISIHYRATPEANNWMKSKISMKSGLGTQIINDRLDIIGAKMNVEIQDGVVTHSIILENENINS